MTKIAQRPFAVFDIDGTLIRWQLYHAVADALVRLGYFDTDIFESVRGARMHWKKRSQEDSFRTYEKSLVDAYESLLTKITVDQFNKAADAVYDEYKDQVYTYTRGLIEDLKQKNYLLFAISGSQAEIVGKIAKHYGFDDWVGSSYEQQAGEFTGKSIVTKDSKHIILDKFVKKYGATYKDSIAVGDSESDISMLDAVEQPIAFNPTRKLLDHSRANNWQIVIERKNVIYKLEAKNGSYVLAKTN